MNNNTMNILVTGANGQLGNEMRLTAIGSTDNYIFTDVTELDITDRKSVFDIVSTKKINVIVNCAAYTNVELAESDANTANLLNNYAVLNLADAAKAYDATLIHISTDYVFNGKSNIPYTEQEQTNPLGVYGQTKFAGEESILKSGCRYIIFRTAWLYSSFGKNFVKTILKLTSEKNAIKVVFDQVGTPTYAYDLATLIHKVIKLRLLNNVGTYHFSNEGVCSWYDFAIEICNLANNSCIIEPCHSSEFPSKVDRPHYSVLDKTKVKDTFDIKIPYWKDSLQQCIIKLKSQNN